MEIDDFAATTLALHLSPTRLIGPGRVGRTLQQNPSRRLEVLGIPRDARGIVLACGFAGAAAIGIAALISPGDPIGYAFIAVALVGYFFLQTRGLPAMLWLLIAAYGAADGLAGAPADWIECGIGLLLAGVSLLPPPANQDDSSSAETDNTTSRAVVQDALPLNGALAVAAAAPNGHDSPIDDVERQPTRSGDPTQLSIRSVGKFSIHAGDQDLAPVLEDKPVLAFLFKYLLACAANGQPKLSRIAVGEEFSPNVPVSSQLKRARTLLYDLQNDVSVELGSLIRSNRSHVWLDLDHADWEVGQLRGMAEQVRQTSGLISSQVATKIRELLDATGLGEFLPGFEQLEHHVTQGHGTAGDLVRDARLSIAKLRADLICALTEYEDALGRPESTIPLLRTALESTDGRIDVARLLITAYLKTGQTARASELRQQYAISKE